MGRGKWENGEMLQGLRSIISRNKIDSGEVKNSRGNGESKEVGPKEAQTKVHYNYISQD